MRDLYKGKHYSENNNLSIKIKVITTVYKKQLDPKFLIYSNT